MLVAEAAVAERVLVAEAVERVLVPCMAWLCSHPMAWLCPRQRRRMRARRAR
ncbi:MAG TPA: hypothetical protein VFC93_17140 [Chloroflexota bacterium]|nr:hypothetical protein [Chloroflexota bacterium]